MADKTLVKTVIFENIILVTIMVRKIACMLAFTA